MHRQDNAERGTITKLLRDSKSRDRVWVRWENGYWNEEEFADADAKPDDQKFWHEVGRFMDNGELVIEVKYYDTYELIGNIFNFEIVPALEPIRKGLKGKRRDEVLAKLEVYVKPKAKSQKKKQKTERSSVPVRRLPERRVRAQGGAD